MFFHEFGKEGEKTVLLIHGLGCNAERSFAIPSAIFSRTYRVITVGLDGYDGDGSAFTTISDQAEKIFNSQYSNMTWRIPDNLEILNHSSTVFFHGSKEKTIIRGAYILKKRLPKMRIICTGEYGHGELMFTDPQRYTELIAKDMRKI